MKFPGWLVMGEGYTIDRMATVGYKPSRKIKALDTVIGAGAVVRSGSVIYAGSHIGDRLETGHNVVIREENQIGDGLSIWSNSVLDYGCQVGNNVRIHCNCYVAQLTVIEDDVFLAPGVQIANDPHPICTLCMKGPTIRKGARIGVNVTILPHVEIGEYALIGAGTVVTRNVPPRSVMTGNPGKVVKMVDELECPFGLVERPYVGGLDVRARGLS